MMRLSPRSARSCAASSPTAPRSSTCRCGSTSTRTPTHRPTRSSRTWRRRWRRPAPHLNRYPDRELTDLRAALADYLSSDGSPGLRPEQVWAANGSNEVMLQLLQAFAGPGRTALSFAPTYSMYPEYARVTNTRWVVGHREDDFSLDLDHARAQVEEHRPAVVLLPSPNNPTGTALPPEAVTRALRGGRRRAGRGRRGVRRVPPRRDAQRPRAAAAAPQPGRHPHHEQGLRARGRPAGLPRGRAGDLRRAPGRPAALPPVRGDPGRGPRGAAARARAARQGRRPPCRTGRLRRLAARAGAEGRGQRRQLRAVRELRRPARRLAGSAGPRGADPRDRPRRLAAGLHRHACGDGNIQEGTDRGAGHREVATSGMEEARDRAVRRRSTAPPRSRRSTSRSTSTAPARPRSPPTSGSTTTCCSPSPGTR